MANNTFSVQDMKSVSKLYEVLKDIYKRIDQAESGGRASQLHQSSVDVSKGQGYIPFYQDGVERARVGLMPDGTIASASVNNPDPPPMPIIPNVTEKIGGCEVYCGGLVADTPYDFSHINVWLNQTVVGTLMNVPDSIFLDLEMGSTNNRVQLSSVNQSGKESAKTAYLQVTPLKVVGSDILDGIISELKIADAAITEAKVAAGAVTNTKIGDNSIDSYKIVANGVQAINIAAAAISTEKLAANAITADKIAANAVTANAIAANAVTATQINAGSITASKLAAQIVLGSRIIAGNTEMNSQGFLAKDANGNITFQVDTSGNLLMMGVFRTAVTGTRLTISEANDNVIRFWPSTGGNWSYIFGYEVTLGSVAYGGINISSSYYNSVASKLNLDPSQMQISRYTNNGFQLSAVTLTDTSSELTYRPNSATTISRVSMSSNYVGMDYSASQWVRCFNSIIEIRAVGDIRLLPKAPYGALTVGAIGTSPPNVILNSTGDDAALLFGPNGVSSYGFGSGQYKAFTAAAFQQASAADVKDNIEEIPFDPVEAIKEAPSKMWVYKADKRDAGGKFKKAIKKFGPMADDLPDALQILTGANGDELGIDLASQIGVLWGALEKIIGRIEELENAGSE